MTQQALFRAFTRKMRKHFSVKTHAPRCSQQHCSRWPRHRNQPSIDGWIKTTWDRGNAAVGDNVRGPRQRHAERTGQTERAEHRATSPTGG